MSMRVGKVSLRREGAERVVTVYYVVGGQQRTKTYRLMTGGTDSDRLAARLALASFISNPEGDY